MQKINNYKDLIVWQKAIQFVVLTYQYTQGFPKQEQFGLTAQLRRASISIPSNIAEGAGRSFHNKDYINFLRIAYSSAQEVETQLIISKELEYLQVEQYNELLMLLVEILKMLGKMLSTKQE